MNLCFMGKKEIEFTGLRDNKMAASLIQADENKIQEKKNILKRKTIGWTYGVSLNKRRKTQFPLTICMRAASQNLKAVICHEPVYIIYAQLYCKICLKLAWKDKISWTSKNVRDCCSFTLRKWYIFLCFLHQFDRAFSSAFFNFYFMPSLFVLRRLESNLFGGKKSINQLKDGKCLTLCRLGQYPISVLSKCSRNTTRNQRRRYSGVHFSLVFWG